MPEEGQSRGVLVIDASVATIGKISGPPIRVTIENGLAVRFEGGPEAARLERILSPFGTAGLAVAELGIGTNHEARISPRVEAAVRLAQASGHTVTIATGRSCPPPRVFARRLGLVSPIICYQGAAIQDVLTRSPIFHRPLPLDLAKEIARWGTASGLDITAYHDDVIYLEEIRREPEFYDRWFGLPMVVVDDLAGSLDGDITKFIVTVAPEDAPGVLEEARSLFGDRAQVVRSHDFFIEFVAKGVSKGDALARLAGYLGVPRDRVVAVGDNENDLDMLRWAGVGVAMGNAPDVVKREADWVAPSIEMDGAAEVLRRFGGIP
jgi:Cof subfamily protein (haloacid dehalogenase superfamily)